MFYFCELFGFFDLPTMCTPGLFGLHGSYAPGLTRPPKSDSGGWGGGGADGNFQTSKRYP